MAANDKKLQPIIIKRIKRGGGHGHHGGAWKIAYADFVTAMMAFFLLMWLLGSTTKGDLKGISDYFNSPLQVALTGGSGSGDSSSIIRGGGEDLTRTSGQVKRGEIDEARRTVNLQALPEDTNKANEQQVKRVRARVEEAIERNPRLNELKGQVRMDLTPEGLRIQIVDDQNRAMFERGGSLVQPYMRELLREIGKVVNEVDAQIALTGHTDSTPYSGGERGYSNWELSTERANASRRELVAGGMNENKVVRVVGLGSTLPLVTDDPAAAVNRRISIVVMNRNAGVGREAQADNVGSFEQALSGSVKAVPSAQSAPAPLSLPVAR
jgi:chemotaxis protein MotB